MRICYSRGARDGKYFANPLSLSGRNPGMTCLSFDFGRSITNCPRDGGYYGAPELPAGLTDACGADSAYATRPTITARRRRSTAGIFHDALNTGR
jgi:hypothetical protein